MDRQIEALKRGAQVVVGTPGRVLDLIRRRELRLDRVHTVILDEADRMLDMGFIVDVETILSRSPARLARRRCSAPPCRSPSCASAIGS